MTLSRSLNAVSAAAAIALIALHGGFAAAQQISVSTRSVPQIVSSGRASFIGPMERGRGLKLALSLPLRNEAELDVLLRDIYDPKSENFHHYLSNEEFTERFAATQQDYDAVVHWARSKGFNITGIAPNRRLVDVEGSIETIDRALQVSVNSYEDSVTHRTFFAPDREPAIDLSVPLLAITGLTNVNLPHPHYRKGSLPVNARGKTQAEGAVAHITGSGPGNTYVPSDMRAAYYGSGLLTGVGQTVGIFSFDGYLANDIQVYYSNTGMTSNVPVNPVLVNGYNGACFGFNSNGTINYNTCDDGEQILDIVNVIGMAPGLTQVLFYEGESATDVLNRMATDNVAKVLSSSWGGGDFGTASDPIFKQFQAQGQSYLNATGDSGQFNGSTYDPPSVDANITQVGGTDLTTTKAGGAWSSETGWPDSGGGYISGTSIPSYQQLPGVINASNKGSTTLRNAPDVAAEANYDNTTVVDGSFVSGYGGTSFATPRWAGLIALANQQAAANGKGSVGFLNPAIYNIGVGSGFASNFHDVVSGNNRPTAGSGSGFNAVTGYDLVTGWGSPIGSKLISTLAGGTTSNPDYFLTTSPGSLSIARSASGTSTVSVTILNGFTGSVSLTASGLPSGITASFSPATTRTTSKLTLKATSFATQGSTTITITGTSGSLAHTATIALTVTSASGGGPSQLIGNSGFESGASTVPWTISSGVICSTSTCSGEAPHAGNWFTWLDGYGAAHTDTVSQKVVIPAGKSSASLSFYLHIDTAETTPTSTYDKLTVKILSTSGAVLSTLATYSNLNAAPGYTLHAHSVSAYIGQTIIVKFTGTEDGSLQTSFVLDDVTLTVK